MRERARGAGALGEGADEESGGGLDEAGGGLDEAGGGLDEGVEASVNPLADPGGGAEPVVAAQGRELRERGRRTLQKLLDAGASVFATRGYHAARVDDIVEAAHTSHGTFYLYFANKEDLFRTLAARVAQEMEDLASELPVVTPDDAGLAVLRAWLARFAQLYTRYGSVIRAWVEAETNASDFGRLGTAVLTEFTAMLTDRIRASAAPGVDAPVAALALVAMIERSHYFVLSRQVKLDRDIMLDTLALIIHRGVFGGQD